MAHLERNRPKPKWAVVFRTIQDTPITLYLCLSEGEHFPSSRQIRLVLRGITSCEPQRLSGNLYL